MCMGVSYANKEVIDALVLGGQSRLCAFIEVLGELVVCRVPSF